MNEITKAYVDTRFLDKRHVSNELLEVLIHEDFDNSTNIGVFPYKSNTIDSSTCQNRCITTLYAPFGTQMECSGGAAEGCGAAGERGGIEGNGEINTVLQRGQGLGWG